MERFTAVCYTCNSSISTRSPGTLSGFMGRHDGHRVFARREVPKGTSMPLSLLKEIQKVRRNA